MLRTAAVPSRRVLCSAVRQRSGGQWLHPSRARRGSIAKRYYSRARRGGNAISGQSSCVDAVVIPRASFTSSARALEADKNVRSPPSPSDDSTIAPESAPKPPHAAKPQTQTSPGSSVNAPEHPATTKPSTSAPPPDSPSPPPPQPPKRKAGKTQRYLLYLFLTTGLAYVGGIWLSLRSDNFHDFFTEYVPYGEDAVLYFEEWDFQRRFPNANRQASRRTPEKRDEGERVVIPSNSGMSWKTSDEDEDGSDVTRIGRHMNAVDANTAQDKPKPKPKAEPKAQDKAKPSPAEKSAKEEPNPAKEETVRPKEAEPAKPKPETGGAKPALEEGRQPLVPAGNVNPVAGEKGDDASVQHLMRIVNDLIAVANADDSAKQLSAPLEKAKEEFEKVADDILAVRSQAQAEAKAEIDAAHAQFDKLATELVQRIDQTRTDEAAQFREEFETEREKLALSYQEKIKNELERVNEVSEQRLRNELMEQAIELNRKFLADVKDLVEKEREGRLSKLSDLTSDVSELEKLTSDWNTVVDTNLKTQQLQVAIDAVRSAVENSDVPRPFLSELVAVKELADSDPVVTAAIDSITPSAYQHGIPSSGQMVDRFRRVASEVRKASLLPEDAGITSHIASFALSKATFKKQLSSEDGDVESILTRTENFLEEGNFDEAAREMNSLNGWARLLSKDWLADVRRVLEVRQALDIIETEARLRCLQVE